MIADASILNPGSDLKHLLDTSIIREVDVSTSHLVTRQYTSSGDERYTHVDSSSFDVIDIYMDLTPKARLVMIDMRFPIPAYP